MILTVRFAHLAEAPNLKVGDQVTRGQVLGIMGSSGQSSAPHVHVDCVYGSQAGAYSLANMEAGIPEPAPPRQLIYFADDELFGVPAVVTTGFADPDYFRSLGKVHLGFDLVPEDRKESRDHYALHWPRSMPGRVTRVAYDAAGYGHHIQIAFEV